MKFIIKLFPEITIKSKPVRKEFTRKLRDNLERLLRRHDERIAVERGWDNLTALAPDDVEGLREQVIEVLARTPGVAHFLEVAEYPLGELHDIYEKTQAIWGHRLAGKRFVVRVKRLGKHAFNSTEVERYVGGGLNMHNPTGGVDLHTPELTVRLEIRDDRLFIVKDRYEGIGGFPLGAMEPVLSLMSGGFDSAVASYLTIRRGMVVHYCFFNLGGRAHELGVKQVAAHLWERYGASHRVKFVAVPFDGVVGEILKNVHNSMMGVVLKRMMLRAATQVAQQLGCAALVTGESVAQVSSQTLPNLAAITTATDALVLRPLITMDKGDIIDIARRIGTEEFSAHMPEYCGVISVRPTTSAKPEKIAQEEEKFDFGVLEQAVAGAKTRWLHEIILEPEQGEDVEVLAAPLAGSVVLDIRHPDEREHAPLEVPGIAVQALPFFELNSRFGELDQGRQYLLYCDRGVMSRLHAAHLLAEGFRNVKVYRPR